MLDLNIHADVARALLRAALALLPAFSGLLAAAPSKAAGLVANRTFPLQENHTIL